jgi:hypothetical protein
MDFKNALKEIISTRKSNKEIENSFFLYSRLSDLCASSYEETKKVSLFYEVDKQVGIVSALLENNMTIYSEHHKVANIISEKNYNSLLDTVKAILDGKSIGNSSQKNASPAPINQPQIQVAAKANAPTNQNNAQILNNNTPRTPLTVNTGVDPDFKYGLIAVAVIVAVVIGLGLLIMLASIFSWPWLFWQWFIGIVVGGVITGALSFLAYVLNDEVVVNFYSFGTFALGACIIINVILLLIFKGNYQVIFGCFSVYSIIAGIILSIFTNTEFESGWMCAQIIETAIALIAMVLGLALV